MLMNIQTTPVLRLLTDYSHSQTIYRLHTASLKLPPDYLNCQKTISSNKYFLGLEDAVCSSRKSLCFKCNLPGCTLGCVALGCRELAHFHCAKGAHWKIDETNFQARCSRHKKS